LIDASRANAGGLAISFQLDQSLVLSGVIQGFKDGFQRDLVVVGEFLGGGRVGAVDGFFDDRRANPSAPEEELTII
jgi:hypothetical protein